MRGQIYVIYTDFAKAFEIIDHSILRRLDGFDFSSNLVNSFRSYLSNRQQNVYLYGTSYITFTAKSGVPQVSHLDSILLNIFINDLTGVTKS